MRRDRTVQASLFDSCFVLRKDKVLRYTDRRHEPCATSAAQDQIYDRRPWNRAQA